MEALIAELSNTADPPAAPPAADNLRISDVIRGSRDIPTISDADPSAESEPFIRAAQDKSVKSEKRRNNSLK
jgi:hypothetical protein